MPKDKKSTSLLIVFNVDVDECITGKHDCDVNANCTNTVGGHNGTCKEGFAGDGRSCAGKQTIMSMCLRQNWYLKLFD